MPLPIGTEDEILAWLERRYKVLGRFSMAVTGMVVMHNLVRPRAVAKNANTSPSWKGIRKC